jgi:hypothetical protein
MKPVITNTSRYPDRAVNWLVAFAYRQVHAVAVREGWLEKLTRYPIALRLTNSSHAYCGRSLGVRSRAKDRRNIYAGSVSERCFLVRVGQPERFPCNSTYARFRDMPEARLECWQEAVVGLTAHELSHTQYSGRREGEINCELVEQDAVAAFRLARSEFDAYMVAGICREENRQAALAAKRSPEAMRATKIAKAEADLKRWTRRAKLAQGKVKKYARRLRALQKAQP